MGVIYSTVEVAGGMLPGPDDHEKAAGQVLERVGSLGTTVLTLVHGSVSEGRAGIRSDLDVLVTYRYERHSEEPAVVDGIKSALDMISDETYVKIEPNIWPAGEAAAVQAERIYDPLFNHYLAVRMTQAAWRVGEPDAAIMERAAGECDTATIRREALKYVTHKHSGFTKAPRHFSEADQRAMAVFQRALEFPNAAGRKIGPLTDQPDHPDASTYEEALSAAGGYDATIDALHDLRLIDRGYTALVTIAAGRTLDADEILDYHQWLNSHYRRAVGLGMVAASGLSRFVAAL